MEMPWEQTGQAGYKSKRGRVLAYGKWHSFGGPVEYRITGERRHTLWLRLGVTVVKVTQATPAAYDAVMMAFYMEARAISYEHYAFGSQQIADAQSNRLLAYANSQGLGHLMDITV